MRVANHRWDVGETVEGRHGRGSTFVRDCHVHPGTPDIHTKDRHELAPKADCNRTAKAIRNLRGAVRRRRWSDSPVGRYGQFADGSQTSGVGELVPAVFATSSPLAARA